MKKILLLVVLIGCLVLNSLAFQGSLVSPEMEFIIGPQAPISNSWFDQNQLVKAREFGEAFPAVPPTDPAAFDKYVLDTYYDLAHTEYIAYQRSGDPAFLAYARNVADSWWQNPWIQEGRQRNFDNGPVPRHAGIAGLALRALDGRPEMWDWLVSYTRDRFDVWLKWRVNNPELHYGVREGAFTLHYATWLAKVLPDSYPLQNGGLATNGAQIRAQFLADVEAISVQYFGRLQYPDGSWRWNTAADEYIDTVQVQLRTGISTGVTSLPVNPIPYPVQAGQRLAFERGGVTKTTVAAPAGATSISVEAVSFTRSGGDYAYVDDGTLQGITQPFMVGLLLNALIDVHRLTQEPFVKSEVAKQILSGARHLYQDGPYRKDVPVPGLTGVNWRDPFYLYHGGTSLNQTKYERGGGSYPDLASNGDCGTNAACTIGIGRQAISTIFDVYGYAYLLTGDPFFRNAGEDLFDAAFVGTDGFRGFADGTAKNYIQNYRMGGRYLGWRLGAQEPSPSPIPTPTPTATPSPVPSPTPTPVPSPSPTPSPSPSPSPKPCTRLPNGKLKKNCLSL
jgi:hypothetical protein